MRIFLLISVFICLSLLIGAVPSSQEGIDVKGMTISCQTWGWEWGTDEMVEAMRELKALGVNWISIHPYARIHSNGVVQSFDGQRKNLSWLTRPIEEAHKLGLKICIKPHIAYWGTKFRWRGDITFQKPEEWQNFFRTTSNWIIELAEICKDADAIVIGTELDRTISYEKEWRAIIQRLRAAYYKPITYAANWTDYQNVPFWDAVDAIGIQAYFPLTQSADIPSSTQLIDAWNDHLQELNNFAEQWGKSIVFTELGYDISTKAAFRPWEPGRYSEEALELQQKCLESALNALAKNDRVVGAFLWKWFPGKTYRENFLKSTPAMRSVIKSYWTSTTSE